MTVECEITSDDLIAFNLYHQENSPVARRQYLAAWFLPPVIWLSLCIGLWYLADYDSGTPLQTFLILLPLFCGVPAYLIYFPWGHRRRLRRVIAGILNEGKNRSVFGHHRITISPEGVTEAGEFGQTSTAWPAVERVVANTDYGFLYVTAVSAIIVPCRAFPTLQAFEEFVEASKNYQSKAAT